MGVAVAIVNFNGGQLVVDAVAAALASSLPIRVYLTDNGSTDGSLEALNSRFSGDPRVRITPNGANLGFAVATNQALGQAADEEHLLLLNPDCLLAPDTLERLIPLFDQYPDTGMLGCLIRNPDGSEQRGCRRRLPTPLSGLLRAFGLPPKGMADQPTIDLHHQLLPAAPQFVEAISGAFMLVRREALTQVGGLDEGYFLHCEDLDWCRRFGDAGWKILFVPQVAVTHAQGTCSRNRPLRVEWHKHRGMVRYYRKFLRKIYPWPLHPLVWLGIWLRFGLVALKIASARVRTR